jgi:hypothetical protein
MPITYFKGSFNSLNTIISFELISAIPNLRDSSTIMKYNIFDDRKLILHKLKNIIGNKMCKIVIKINFSIRKLKLEVGYYNN